MVESSQRLKFEFAAFPLSIRKNPGWFRIRISCPSEAIHIPANFSFNELALTPTKHVGLLGCTAYCICNSFFCVSLQENCNLKVSAEYSEQTKRAMGMLSEKEMSFELIEVSIHYTVKPV